MKFAESRQGKDQRLHELVTTIVEVVVPSLIGDAHLNGGKGIQPVVVHGDLWSGNAAVGRIFDSSACYAHSEFDLGIMSMFGGFDSSFFSDYHKLCPRAEPKDEYDDRINLYKL